MKISSRSTLSPARAAYSREPPPLPPISLSTSLSRRLSNSRSIKGGASPAMFPVSGKKRGCGFDNPEPSSPKVTCIGQVRVKSKKKHAKTVRSLSRRRSSGDVNFRKLEHSRSQNQGNQHLKCLQGQRNCNNNNNNQRWVHIPLTICEALRAFGSEVSCLFPCRSSCSSTMENEEKMGMEVEEGGKHGSCGAVIARWLVALQDGDGGDRRCVDGGGGGDVEMVAEDDDGDDVGNVRRHVFDNLEIVNDVILGSKDEARVSICVPPKNALLLMRCRSDPMKMEALTNRFWEPTMNINEETDEAEEFVDVEDKMVENKIPQEELQTEDEKPMVLDEDNVREDEHLQKHETFEGIVEINSEMEMEEGVEEDEREMLAKQSIREEDEQEQGIETNEEDEQEQGIETNEEDEQEQGIETNEEEESFFLGSLFEENAVQVQELEEEEEEESDMEDAQDELFEDEDVQETATGESNVEQIQHFEEEIEEIKTEIEKNAEIEAEYEKIKAENAEISTEIEQNTEFEAEYEEIKAENAEIYTEIEEITDIEAENEEIEVENEEIEVKDKSIESLPECLLLMMYEPKLSMEVSKETWVCSSDFIRRHSGRNQPPPPPPEPPVQPIDGQPVSQQPARSSCSFPAPHSKIGLEQNLVSTMGLEPMVLTRCKSEPMREAAASEGCYWTNKLEPPRRASFEVGLAG